MTIIHFVPTESAYRERVLLHASHELQDRLNYFLTTLDDLLTSDQFRPLDIDRKELKHLIEELDTNPLTSEAGFRACAAVLTTCRDIVGQARAIEAAGNDTPTSDPALGCQLAGTIFP